MCLFRSCCLTQCEQCRRQGAEFILRRCGSCRRALYCSVACQKISWLNDGHRFLCFNFNDKPSHRKSDLVLFLIYLTDTASVTGLAFSLLHHTILYLAVMSDLEHYIPRNLHRLAVQRRTLPENVAMTYKVDYTVFPPTIQCEHVTATEMLRHLERFSRIGDHKCNITVLAPWGSDGPGGIFFWGPSSDLYYAYPTSGTLSICPARLDLYLSRDLRQPPSWMSLAGSLNCSSLRFLPYAALHRYIF